MIAFLLFLAVAAAACLLGYWLRGPVLEHREALVRYARWCADRDLETAQLVREQADEMLFNAEWAAISARALTTPTQALQTVRERAGAAWLSARERMRLIRPAEHVGWEGEHAAQLAAIAAPSQSRANWPLRSRRRPTPFVMPQHLPADPERRFRVHMLARNAT